MRNQKIRLYFFKLKEIKEKIGDVGLVLHGGSGTPVEDVQKAIQMGVIKVNVNTELRIAYTMSLKKALEENPDQTTPYKLFPPVVEAVQKVIEEKIKIFKKI